MTIENMHNTMTPSKSSNDINDARLNVLYSPFRKREVNPQDWESKMSYWKNIILNWCLDNRCYVFSTLKLQSVFLRNGRPASCLATVVDDMLRNNEIISVQDLLSRDPSIQSWSSWAVNSLVKAPIIWSFSKLKESLVAKPESDLNTEYVHLAVLKRHADQLINYGKQVLNLEEVKSILGIKDERSVTVLLHWLQMEKQAAVRTVGGDTVLRVGEEKVTSVTDADVALLRLTNTERVLTRTVCQLEEERKSADEEARSYIRRGMRQAAKSCLRKKKELEKCIDKRASALENVQVLISRVKEAESDGEILESYKVGLSALKETFKSAGLSEDGVESTMDEVKEVLEVHDEVQNALSGPLGDSLDQDLESELAALLAADTKTAQPVPAKTTSTSYLIDLPEPPSHSPSSSRIAQSVSS